MRKKIFLLTLIILLILPLNVLAVTKSFSTSANISVQGIDNVTLWVEGQTFHYNFYSNQTSNNIYSIQRELDNWYADTVINVASVENLTDQCTKIGAHMLEQGEQLATISDYMYTFLNYSERYNNCLFVKSSLETQVNNLRNSTNERDYYLDELNSYKTQLEVCLNENTNLQQNRIPISQCESEKKNSMFGYLILGAVIGAAAIFVINENKKKKVNARPPEQVGGVLRE